MGRFIPIILGILGAVVGLPEEARDVAGWGAGTGALAVATLGFVAYLRARVFHALDGAAVTFVSIAVATTISVALGLGGLLTGAFADWVAYGLTAGFSASMLVDGTRAATGALRKT